jgi:hypothetical protein
MKNRKSSIPWLRQRQQKSGATYFYFEIPESKPREEIALGSDHEAALIQRRQLLLNFRAGKRSENSDLVFALNLYREIVVPTLDAIPQKENLATIEKLVAFFRGSKFGFGDIDSPELQEAYALWSNPKLQLRIKSDLSLLKRIHREFSKWNLLDTRPKGIDDSEPFCLQDITAIVR